MMVEIELPPGIIRECKKCNDKVAKSTFDIRVSRYPVGIAELVTKSVTTYKKFCTKCRYTTAISEDEYNEKAEKESLIDSRTIECVTCREHKSIKDYRFSDVRNRLDTQCKKCFSKYSKDRYIKRKQERKDKRALELKIKIEKDLKLAREREERLAIRSEKQNIKKEKIAKKDRRLESRRLIQEENTRIKLKALDDRLKKKQARQEEKDQNKRLRFKEREDEILENNILKAKIKNEKIAKKAVEAIATLDKQKARAERIESNRVKNIEKQNGIKERKELKLIKDKEAESAKQDRETDTHRKQRLLYIWFKKHALKSKGIDSDSADLAAKEGVRMYLTNAYKKIDDIFEMVKQKAKKLRSKT